MGDAAEVRGGEGDDPTHGAAVLQPSSFPSYLGGTDIDTAQCKPNVAELIWRDQVFMHLDPVCVFGSTWTISYFDIPQV